MLVLTWGLPYVGLVTGYLATYRQVKDWKGLYFGSEETRTRAVNALEAATTAIEKMVQIAQEDRAAIREMLSMAKEDRT